MNSLTLLTTTGARPEAFALCERWMQRQTYCGPVRWIVVDDGAQPQRIAFARKGWRVDVIRPEPRWRHGENTQARNLLAGLDAHDPHAPLLIIEDDDWYAPGWLAACAEHLRLAEVVGERFARYYNVRARRSKQLANGQHASLCSTALRGDALKRLREICHRSPRFIDIDLWAGPATKKRLLDSHLVVGIKGMPGRGGIGMGHDAAHIARFDDDASGKTLLTWVGEDAALYEQFRAGAA